MEQNIFLSNKARNITPYTAGLQPTGDIIKLNTNENPYAPSADVAKILNDFDINTLPLYPPSDGGEFRKTCAKINNVSVKNIFCGNGSDEVLALAFCAFFDEEISVPDITYSFYPVWANLFGIKLNTVPVNEDFSLNIHGLFNSKNGVVLANPNAPTGLYLSLDKIEEILLNNQNRVVIIDEAYIAFGGQSALKLLSKYENLLIVRTLSKSHSLAGMRAGYAIGGERLIDGLTRIKDSFNSYPVNHLTIALSSAALNDNEYYLNTAQKIIATRNKTQSELLSLGFKILPSMTNFVFAKHEKIYAQKIHDYLVHKNIYVRHFNQLRIENYLRITIGTDKQMDKLIYALKQL